jgi:hypothetical protein
MSISFGLYRINIRCDLQFRPSTKSSPVTPRFWAILGMSASGHEQTSRHVRVMSIISLKADIHQRRLHVRLVP